MQQSKSNLSVYINLAACKRTNNKGFGSKLSKQFHHVS